VLHLAGSELEAKRAEPLLAVWSRLTPRATSWPLWSGGRARPHPQTTWSWPLSSAQKDHGSAQIGYERPIKKRCGVL